MTLVVDEVSTIFGVIVILFESGASGDGWRGGKVVEMADFGHFSGDGH